MDHSYESSTVQMDDAGFESLQDQILNNKHTKHTQDIRDAIPETEREHIPQSKKYVFRKGDQSLEIDEDYEIELMADKKPTRLTLRELRDRASGDIAIKSRMHQLAEEKKRVQSTFSEFSQIAKNDPLAALEYIARKANESDSEFEYEKYLEKLADQADQLGRMTEEERKNWELEKKLSKAERDLSQKEQTEYVLMRRQELLSDYPEIGNQQFAEMVDAVLENEDLMDGLEDEHDVMNRVEDLIQETLTQRDIMSVIQEINPRYIDDSALIFSLSDQLKQNPDLDEEDVRDIIRELVGPAPVQRVVDRSTQRDRDAMILSERSRQKTPAYQQRMQDVTPYDLLAQQLQDKKKEIQKTPLNRR